ncbi:MAG: hypothetical protein AAB466_13550 [Verrucomicrobiota bacterium]
MKGPAPFLITNLANPNRPVFLDIFSRITGGVPSDERGLLGLAFHPGYATNRFFYVFYTGAHTTPAGTGLHDKLARFQTAPSDPTQGLAEGDGGIAAFGLDPRNGDVLMADQSEDTIKRLVYNSTPTGAPLPPTLAETGAFADVRLLTPNPGVVPYDVNVPVWSDYAQQRRWFSVPDPNLTVGFSRSDKWAFPTGTVWIQHFEMELTTGVPESARRLETRFLIRSKEGVYGLTSRWADSFTNATLVPEEGMEETLVVQENGRPRTQVWHYPSRSECLACHNSTAGWALGFNTPQMNRPFGYGETPSNQARLVERLPALEPHLYD